MSKAEALIKLGYSMEQLNSLIMSGKIEYYKNELYIHDFDVLFDIINKTDEYFLLRHYTDRQINFELYELFRLIRLGKYEIAHKLAERIYKDNKIPEVKLIIDNLKYSKDYVKYIIEEEIYDNKEIVEKYKEMELDMLLDFYCGRTKEVEEKMTQLFSLYIYQNTIDFKAYIAYQEKIEALKTHHTKINKRRNEGAIGDPLAVLTALLISEDFYRAHNVLKEYYLSNDAAEFSIIWEILRLLDVKLMIILRENTRNVEKIVDLNSNGLNDEEVIMKDYNLSYLSDDIINRLQKADKTIDPKIDYFGLYKEKKLQHKYKEAKDALNKHQFIINSNNLDYNFDYLIYELNILEENYKECKAIDLNIRDRLIEEGNDLFNNNKYEVAILKYIESLKYEKHKSPSTLSKLGICYLKLGMYLEAYLIYKSEEKDFLYPEDYKCILECIYRLGKTEDAASYVDKDSAASYVDKYDERFPNSDSFMHYILSLMHLENKDYEKALDEISMCEIIDYYNTLLPLSYCYERNIIHALMNGKDVQPYELECYYDHVYTDEVMDRVTELDIESREEGTVLDYIRWQRYDDDIKSLIEYLEYLYKILKEMDRRVDAEELSAYIESIISSNDLSNEDKKNFTLVLKNYRNL